jgi:hypothetical protein
MRRRLSAWIGEITGKLQDRASSWLERYCEIDEARREAVIIDIVRYWGPSRDEIALRKYMENYSFPAHIARLIERYPVIAVYSRTPIFRHRIRDVAFFHLDLNNRKNLERLLTEVAYRSFIQRASIMGLGSRYRSSDRLWAAFERRLLNRRSKSPSE